MASLTDLPNPGAALGGLITEALGDQVLGVKGRVEVDIVDDRTGRVVDRLASPNYVNQVEWTRFAKALQRLAWTWGYQGDASTVTVSNDTSRDPRYPPTFRNDHIACWTDATAEDTNDIFTFGEIVAWAHRWQQGAPSNRQGIVQPTLCTLSDTGISWVWEWSTGQGNGTFQSVGWRRLSWAANTGNPILADLYNPSRRATALPTDTISAGGSSDLTWTGAPAQQSAPVYYDSTSQKMFFYTNPSNMKLYSLAVTIDSRGDYSLGAFVDESASAIAAGLTGDNFAFSTRAAQGLTRMGPSGDWISVGHTAASTARRPFIRRVTPAGTITYTNANAATYSTESGFVDCAYDGTNIWAIAVSTTAGTTVIHRIDPATGNITATITSITNAPTYFPGPSTGVGGRAYTGIEWDAVNGWLWLATNAGYTFNIDTSGNWLGTLLTANSIATPTLSGLHNTRTGTTRYGSDADGVLLIGTATGLNNTDSTDPWNQAASGVPAADPANSASTAWSPTGRLTTMDGHVWAQESSSAFNGIGKYALNAFTEQRNFASRALLAAPATKNNTQTMRVRYTITFT